MEFCTYASALVTYGVKFLYTIGQMTVGIATTSVTAGIAMTIEV